MISGQYLVYGVDTIEYNLQKMVVYSQKSKRAVIYDVKHFKGMNESLQP